MLSLSENENLAIYLYRKNFTQYTIPIENYFPALYEQYLTIITVCDDRKNDKRT